MQKEGNPIAMNSFVKKCRAHGLKVTPQRTAIYQGLSGAKDHPSVDAIFKKVRMVLPSISFDTVYRTVLSFADVGIIHMVEGCGGSKRFDPDISQHHHFKCSKCEKIIDFCSDYYDQIKIPNELKDQFQVISKNVFLEGLCKKCAKKR
jgi:Fur family transcriptional regulator, peroxide stress response regulator